MSRPVYKNSKHEKQKMVFQKTNGRCWYCGVDVRLWFLEPETSWEGIMYSDHVIPLNKGGTDLLNNIVPSCRDCNRLKSNRTLDDFRNKLFSGKNDKRFYFEIAGLS